MIDRREFLQRSALAGTAMLIGSRTSFGASAEVNLEEATVAGLHAAMGSGQTSARKIAEGYLARIAEIDKNLTRSSSLIPMRSRSPTAATPSEGPPKNFWGRCMEYPSLSRTTSTPPIK